MKQQIVRSLVLALSLGICGSAEAVLNEYTEGKKLDAAAKKTAAAAKVPWRNSLIVYENSLNALALDEGAELTYNPIYSQSLSFRPRFYLRDDLSLRGRLDLEIELTTSDDTDHAREWILSDLYLDLNYNPSWMTIPVVKIQVAPSMRVMLPTSIVSRGRSMMAALAPGVALRRQFKLMSGRFLRSLGLTYGLRYYKYLHEYTTAQLNTSGICTLSNPDNPACLTNGVRNVSQRLLNSFSARLEIMEKLTFNAAVLLYNNFLYGIDGGTEELQDGPTVTTEDSRINHRGATWVILDVSYDLFDWLWLSLGTSTYAPHLTPNSQYRVPIFNRYTAFYFDITLPVDRFVNQIQSWVR